MDAVWANILAVGLTEEVQKKAKQMIRFFRPLTGKAEKGSLEGSCGMTYQEVIANFCHDRSTPLFVGVYPERVPCPEVRAGASTITARVSRGNGIPQRNWLSYYCLLSLLNTCFGGEGNGLKKYHNHN